MSAPLAPYQMAGSLLTGAPCEHIPPQAWAAGVPGYDALQSEFPLSICHFHSLLLQLKSLAFGESHDQGKAEDGVSLPLCLARGCQSRDIFQNERIRFLTSLACSSLLSKLFGSPLLLTFTPDLYRAGADSRGAEGCPAQGSNCPTPHVRGLHCEAQSTAKISNAYLGYCPPEDFPPSEYAR